MIHPIVGLITAIFLIVQGVVTILVCGVGLHHEAQKNGDFAAVKVLFVWGIVSLVLGILMLL